MSGQHSDADLNKPYEPSAVEERWYTFWEKEGVFDASVDESDKRPAYVIPMPPPNVTGSLHMGHAFFCTLEDALTRYHRMCGRNTLWQPGMDHAGIATQTVVERQLQREGKTRHDLGRDAFIERVWKWKAESGDRIQQQQRVMGASADWKRSKFTMDTGMSAAVTEAFVRLYEQGLIYRATRLINWCPECQTALSDLEVDNEEGANGELFEFAYKVSGTSDEIIVATTRPETMLGDTAVAVHPGDPRYTHLHGKFLDHPFVDRKIPIITDAILVDPKFGTGAVKVTPAHDFNDFATGKRHNLPEINIFNLDGTVNESGGEFQGLERKRARTAVKKALDEKGLARGAKPHVLTLPKCQRSGGVVEPMISTQWFCKMEAMANAALDAVNTGKTEIIPVEWKKTYDHFLSNIQDWCVSRQLWWGHQIPAWHGPDGQIVVARERPLSCGEGWNQDPDVLDTWFSSALWPFSTLGWPSDTPALRKFYPASDLETGYDILFFWVARMMMFGIHFMGEPPFKRILLHGLIVDETGDKMSKVKGNVIDPLDLIHGATFNEIVSKTMPGAPEAESLSKFKKAYPSAASMGTGFPAFGTDAVRHALGTYPPSNMRIALAPKRIEASRHFLNKIWNATRLSLEFLADYQVPEKATPPSDLVNQWILSRVGNATRVMRNGLDHFRIDETANESYRFFWTEFCDWYLELVKPTLRKNEQGEYANPALAKETQATLATALEAALRLMHPVTPFITEELWQRLPKAKSSPISIALAPYPTDTTVNADAERKMAILQGVISAARTIRAEHEIKRQSEVPLTLRTDDAATRAFLTARLGDISFLVNAGKERPIAIEASSKARESGTTVSVVPSESGPIEVLVGLKGLVEPEKERTRIERELKRIEKDLGAIEKKLSSPGFVDRAPKEVIEESNTQRRTMIEARARLEASKTLVDEL